MFRKYKRKSKWNFNNIDWEEFMSNQFLTIYNLEKKPCLINSCKRNCSDNLYCINKLGETKWMIKKNQSNDNDEMSILNQETNFAAGLKNYGNTCYFNSLLQVYFNIVELKEAVFRFPINDIPDEIITYLQTIFAQMQLSVHKTVDPVELINALELPQLEQQDAPEFHSLFMNLVDQRFSLIDDNVIKNLISGTLGYLTRCKGCGYESQINCQFREIDLKPMFSFDQALNDFLKVELLTDDNKYDCSCCMNKCDSERQTVLQNLPPLLCFQFLRYSYDNSGTKKKNCSNVGFSSHLSMDNYITKKKNQKNNQYIIKAILIHIGLQPTSGHYQTLIHTSNHEWIHYDDLNVQKIENIDDVKKILGQKKSNVNKSERKNLKDSNDSISFISSNAYMVFYERQDVFHSHSNNTQSVEVPSHLKVNITLRNELYLSELETKRREQVENQERFEKESEVIIEAFNKLFYSKPNENLLLLSNEIEFFPTSWITKCFLHGRKINGLEEITENTIDDLEEWKSLLCCHEMLGPDISLSQIKIVNSVGVDFLIENQFLSTNYKRIRLSNLCNRCWRLKFEIKKFENVSKDDVQIDNCIKIPLNDNVIDQKYYWMSKIHLRQWRKIIRLSIENKFSDSKENQEEYNSGSSSSKELSSNVLNSDLLCSHNNLSIDGSKRILILEEVWHKILSYFPKPSTDAEEKHYIEFPYNCATKDGCQVCSSQLSDVIKKSENEKINLSKIINSKKRFEFNINDRKIVSLSPYNELDCIEEEIFLYLIPTSFITLWKRFIKNPSVDTLLTEIDYTDVFCQHGKFLSKEWWHFVEDDVFYILWQSEWEKIIKYYPEIDFVNIALKVDNKLSRCPEMMSPLIVCDSCYQEWNALQSRFENSVIYVRLISRKEDNSEDALEEGPAKKKIKQNHSELQRDFTDSSCRMDPNSIRRSARSKRHRNDTILKINSDDQIKDIKLKLMNIYNVSPIDQHIIFNDQELVNSECTISHAGITPSSILYLILDTEFINNIEPANGSLETGFSGTKLMQSLR